MKKKIIILLSITCAVLLYDACDLILNLVFNIYNEGIDITAHGLVCLLMCAYANFFVKATYDIYIKREENLTFSKINSQKPTNNEGTKENDRFLKTPDLSGHNH